MTSLFDSLTRPFNPNQTENDINVSWDNMFRTMDYEGGHKEKAYLDSEGYPTIGTGHLLENKRYEVPEGEDPKTWVPEQYRDMNWTEEQGEKTFLEDYLKMQKDVSNRYGQDAFSNLPEEAQGILTDLAFNIGAEGLFGGENAKGFPGFLEDFRAGKYGEAAKELKFKNPDEGNLDISKWWEQVGGKKTEKKILSGEWDKNYSREANRATATFDMLMQLMNQVK
tara:strand:- start:771 stop:1442 length:672 start_codon:yes stop_codon:yes gene_type:complete